MNKSPFGGPVAAKQPEEPWRQLRENIIAKVYDTVKEDTSVILLTTANTKGQTSCTVFGNPFYAAKIARALEGEVMDLIWQEVNSRLPKPEEVKVEEKDVQGETGDSSEITSDAPKEHTQDITVQSPSRGETLTPQD